MRHPLWILNSALLFLLIIAMFFIIFSRESMPEWESIEPSSFPKPMQKRPTEINIAKIYENDLFGTYEKKEIGPEEPEYVIPFPEPPQPRKVQIPKEPVPQFVDPLNI